MNKTNEIIQKIKLQICEIKPHSSPKTMFGYSEIIENNLAARIYLNSSCFIFISSGVREGFGASAFLALAGT